MNINDYKDVNGNVLVSETLVSDLIGGINMDFDLVSDNKWVKFHNGLMIAWGKTSITGNIYSWVDSGNGWFYSPEVSWTYPVGFIGTPHMIATFNDERVADRGSWAIRSATELTYASFRAGSHRASSVNNDFPIIITIFLIGRWK